MSEVLKDFSANIDLKQSLVNEDVKVVEGDNGNVLVLNIVKDGEPVDLTDCLVQIVFAHSGRTVWQDSSSPSGGITISGAENNIVTVRLHSDSYAPNGITVCQVKVYSGTGQTTLVSSSRFSFKAELSLLNAETVESIEQYSILVTLIEACNSVLDRDQADWDETDTLKVSFIKNKPVIGIDIQDATQNLTAETTLADTDTVPFYDASATAHRKSTWSNIVAKIRTALFGSVTGLLKLDGAGNASAGLANTDFAAATHASRHAAGAADALAPGDIGAAAATHADRHATGGSDPLLPASIGAAELVDGIVKASQAKVKVIYRTASFIADASDAETLQLMNNASASVITLPSNLPIGTSISAVRWATGSVTFAYGSGAGGIAANGLLSISAAGNGAIATVVADTTWWIRCE